MQVKLFSASTSAGTVNALVTYQVPRKMKLVAVSWHVGLSTSTSPSNAIYELSRSSANQFSTNDPQGVISQLYASMGSSGASNMIHTNYLHIGLNEAFESGDRLYLHRYFGSTGANEPASSLILTFV